MNEAEPQTTLSKRRLVTLTNVVLVGLALLVYAGYWYLLNSMAPLDMGDYRFQFFPIPRYTAIGEQLFLLLLIGVAVWHIKLALEKNGDPSTRKRVGRLGQLIFALFLLTVPLIFRGCSNLILHLING